MKKKFCLLFLLFIACMTPGAAWGATATFNLATGTGTGGGYTWADPILTVGNSANIIVTGTVSNGRRIVVAENASASITLNNVSITSLDIDLSPLLLNTSADVTLTLLGTNTLTAGIGSAGIQTTGATLTINGTGSLTATGVHGGAGIGGSDGGAGGEITITDGTVIATSAILLGSGGAGIGGGYNGAGGIITISGGTVEANGTYGAGIGGGNSYGSGGSGGDGGTITITGGTVTASGSRGGAGIGGGNRYGSGGDGGTITITGGTVTASGSGGSAGIGGGYYGAGGTITISGGTVEANGTYGAGIGGGANGAGGGTITITGGTVTATGGFGGAGIGGGENATDGGTLTMNGDGVVYASSLENSKGTATNTSGVKNGILFDGDEGTVYGNVALTDDLTIEDEQKLTIPDNATLTIPNDVTLENNGTITNNGKIYSRIDGIKGTGDPPGGIVENKTVSVGTQSEALKPGEPGEVTFPVTTANIDDGSYNVTVANLPVGVTADEQVTISNNTGTLTLAGTTSTEAGAANNLRLTLTSDDIKITSSAFTLTISDPPGPPGPVSPDGGGCAAGAGMAGALIPVLALWGTRRRKE